MMRKSCLIVIALMVSISTLFAQEVKMVDVLVVGGGASGTAAGIQAARMKVKTLIVEETPWLGGMISAAGVSAIDGNHRLPSGIWGEFRAQLYQYYGGPKAVATGWVSNTQFEPHVADSIWKALAAKEPNLSVEYGWQFNKAIVQGNAIKGAVFTASNGKTLTVNATITIDATELGDVLASAGVPYQLGMESDASSGEKIGVKADNDIVQDLTWVATLKEHPKGMDFTIPRPANYDSMEFDGACTNFYINKVLKAPSVDAKKMLDYGKLPNNKYMINWPGHGNDIYLNVVEMTPAQRLVELEKAKEQTKRFVYFIQSTLGFKEFELYNEYGTKDGLAWIPYHRESRRVKGLARFTISHVSNPYEYGLYRTGIAVGDYPIDHHHAKNPKAPELHFPPVPSYTIPVGALIPQQHQGLVIAEKSISVSNGVNGATRLQPVVLCIGQAAGVIAASAILDKLEPNQLQIRTIQQRLLSANGYLQPFLDVLKEDPAFAAIQRIGSTGILKGKGIAIHWANQTWFYPDSTIKKQVLIKGLQEVYPTVTFDAADELLTYQQTFDIVKKVAMQENITFPKKLTKKNWNQFFVGLPYRPNEHINRKQLALMIDHTLQPFSKKAINHLGEYTDF